MIEIGKVVYKQRHNRKLTQEQLAVVFGVTKATISKWELGKSYPDIEMLPMIANYFSLTLDELLHYEPQLTKEEIRQKYQAAAQLFNEKPYKEAFEIIEKEIKHYYACMPYLLQMALLYINHYSLASNESLQKKILKQADHLLQRILQESTDVSILRQANAFQGLVQLSLGYPEKTIERLKESVTAPQSIGEPLVLAQAYQQIGQSQQAIETIQVTIYQQLVLLVNGLVLLMQTTAPTDPKFNQLLKRIRKIEAVFHLRKLHPNLVLQFEFQQALSYAQIQNEEKTLQALENYSKICQQNLLPFSLHGDDFFTDIDNWLETLDLGANPLRSETTIIDSLLQSILLPTFQFLQDHKVYQLLVRQMHHHFGRELP